MAESFRIHFDDNKRAFRPGEEIRGRAEWSIDQVPSHAAVHLCWFTRGKGTEDAEMVIEQKLENPGSSDGRPFSFRAPDQPYSFSGQLISLIWAVELALDPGDHCERVEITIGPEAREIELPATVPDEKPGFLQTLPAR